MAKKSNQYWRHTVSDVDGKEDVISYCAHHFRILGSRSAVKKAIAGGRLLLNGKIAGFTDRVRRGDRLELQGSGIQKAKKFDADLEIVYEDDLLLVVNKPGGIAVNGNRNKTVENAVADRNRQNSQPDALPRPVAVHRIDVPTSGLVMLAKTKTALIEMSRAFQEGEVRKEYLAVVHGKMPAGGTIDRPIEGKEAETRYKTLDTAPSRVFRHLSLARLQLITGRTHQLRIHLRGEGYPIVGDKAYMDDRKTLLGKGLFLCSCKMQFKHPGTGRLTELEIEPPSKFSRLMERERERFG
jgi:RluA family pseudouridine synthase